MSMMPIGPDECRRCFSQCPPGIFCACEGRIIEDTPPMTNDPAAIARGLTAAQWRWLPAFAEQPQKLLPIGMSRKTRDSLKKLGLIDSAAPATGFGFMSWWLTPLGLAVRAHLL